MKFTFFTLILAFLLAFSSISAADQSPDINGDGIVNIYDLQLMVNQWLNSGSADIDGSGKVNLLDFKTINQSWMQIVGLSAQQKFLRISEIMYNPQAGDLDGDEYEFLELVNIGTSPLNLNGAAFTFGIDIAFGDLTIPAGSHGLIVKNPTAFADRYGLGYDILGTYTGSLSNGGEGITLVDSNGSIIVDFIYQDSWYDATDGNGFSLVVADENSSNDLGLVSSWRVSYALWGSPGATDIGGVAIPDGAIIINEVMAHSDDSNPDWIELYNTTDQPINISGWFLSDSETDLTKFEIAQGTVVNAHAYKVFTETAHFNKNSNPGAHTPFALSENGETVVLSSGLNGVVTAYSEKQDFGPSLKNVSIGTYTTSAGKIEFVQLSTPTIASSNSSPKVGPIIISEIMYNSDKDDDAEYIELKNISSSSVTLFDSEVSLPWKFIDSGGIDFSFPNNTTIPAGGAIIVAKDVAIFNSNYNTPTGTVVLGWVDGGLSNKGEKIKLIQPGDIDKDGIRQYVDVDVIDYGDSSPWPEGADGDGKALGRVSNQYFGDDPASWQDIIPSPGQ
ncbi:MAG: lamin tail domain-containing protein [Phycisphaerae bacterium]|nr:lamin tail domain-containing protein [Phycisphaerae bacterium]